MTEDIDRNGNGIFDYGDALQVTWTDSWDDNQPTNCGGANNIDVNLDGNITADEDARCFDGLRNFNQVRPGVFDGGYAFGDYNLDEPRPGLNRCCGQARRRSTRIARRLRPRCRMPG